MNDYLALLPTTLAWIAERLDRVSPIPWPFWIGGLFPLYLAALSFTLWFMRGAVWPVRCAYPVTSRKHDCRLVVAGEWRRCRHHNKAVSYRFGHTVNRKIRRWERVVGDKLVDRGSRGVGLIRMRPRGDTLLYRHGYTRRPLDVLRILPDYWHRLRAVVRAVRRRVLGGDYSEPDDGSSAPEADLAVTGELETVVRATRFALGVFAVGLITAAAAVPFDGTLRIVLQYVSTLALVVAWAATSAGFFRRDESWFSHACVTTVKWWARIFVPVGVINLLFALAG